MLSCSDTTQRVSEGLDRPLPLHTRLGLRLHLLMCGACRRFSRQVTGIERILRRRDGESAAASRTTGDPQGLSPAKREEIKRALRR